MRIAHVANMYGPKSGGLRTAMDQIGIEYSNRGHQFLKVFPGKSSVIEQSGHVREIGVHGITIPKSGGYRIILNLRKVKEAIERFNPEVLEVSDRSTLPLLMPWARKKGIKTVLFAHERLETAVSSYVGTSPALTFLMAKWNQWCSRFADEVIATTLYAAEEFNGLREVRVVPLGVDESTFSIKGFDQRGPGITLFACTRLAPEKDPEFLIEIAREIKNRGLDYRIAIAGSGPLENRMRALSEVEELNIHLLGFVEDKSRLAALMREADLFLAPGPIETFGLAALEALAVGTPVICRASGAIREIIDDQCGLSLARDPVVWLEGARELLNRNRENLREAASSRARHFSWSITVDQLLKIYLSEETLECA